MRRLLIALLVVSFLAGGCIKLGGIIMPAGKAGEQAGTQSPSDNAGLAQNPGGLQSLPVLQKGGGQSGSLPGINPPPGLPAGVPVSPNIGQFNQPAQGSSQSQGMGALPSSGQAGNQSTVGMAGLKKNLPAFGNSWGMDSGLISTPSTWERLSYCNGRFPMRTCWQLMWLALR